MGIGKTSGLVALALAAGIGCKPDYKTSDPSYTIDERVEVQLPSECIEEITGGYLTRDSFVDMDVAVCKNNKGGITVYVKPVNAFSWTARVHRR